MIRAALVGAGDISGMHVAAIDEIEGAELVAVVEPDADRRAQASRQWGVPAVAGLDELLERVTPDVVHVTTPHHHHADVSTALLRRGIPVLQEKPLAHSRAAADELVEVAEQTNTRFGVCFQNRYNLSSQHLKSVLEAGELGEIEGAWANVVWHRTPAYYADRPWRGRLAEAGSGVLANQSIHTLDLLQWLFGGVEQITGLTGTTALGEVVEVEDTASARIVHPGGHSSNFHATVASPVHRPVEIVVWGSRGMARIFEGLELTWYDSGKVETLPERVPTGPRAYWGASHELLIRDFYERLADDQPFWIDAREADVTMRMMREIFAHQGLTDHPMVAG